MKRHLVNIIALFVLLSQGAVNAASAKDEVSGLVRSLGYGAAIHSFKNYVLRGRDGDYARAKQSFGAASNHLDNLQATSEMGVEDRNALVTMKAMIQSYVKGLDRIIELRDKGWRLEDIDRSVTVDDSKAIAALDTLRSKWNWSDIEEIEYQLGYGKGIHSFKNYLLRQNERYHTQALESFLAVESLIVNQLNMHSSESDERTSLERIGRVAQAYRNYLGLIQRMHSMQRSERQIDLAVKINDGPAVTGLSQLFK